MVRLKWLFFWKIVLSTCLLNAQDYCDDPSFFIEKGSTSSLLAEPIAYCVDCPDEEGNLVTCNILLYRPIDLLNDAIPNRPHLMFVHGFAPNSDLHDPLSILAATSIRENFTLYGYSGSALQYRQDIKGFQADVCAIPTIEVVKTHYRAIQDVRGAIDLLFRNADLYGIDTANFFLYGNSQGGMAVLHAAFVEDEEEWLAGQFSEFSAIIQDLGPWAPKHQIKGVISLAAGIYDVNYIDPSEDSALFLAHGVCDEVVPIDAGTYFNCPEEFQIFGAVEIACRAKSIEMPYSLHMINGLGHAWPEEVVDETTFQIRDWMRNQIICGVPGQEEFIYYANEELCDTLGTNTDFCLTSGILPEEGDFALRVYPNPAKDLLMIRIPDNTHQRELKVQIQNANGQLQVRIDVLNDGMVDISNIPRGVHFLIVYIGGEVYVDRFLKI